MIRSIITVPPTFHGHSSATRVAAARFGRAGDRPVSRAQSAADIGLSAGRCGDRSACRQALAGVGGNPPPGGVRRGLPDVHHRPGILAAATHEHEAHRVRSGSGAGLGDLCRNPVVRLAAGSFLARRAGVGRGAGDVVDRGGQQASGRAHGTGFRARQPDHGRVVVPGSCRGAIVDSPAGACGGARFARRHAPGRRQSDCVGRAGRRAVAVGPATQPGG